ncbi:MAG: vitamin B12 dependent methionine synthase, partial [Clostridia bacterium]|nr:vitamin B12 dependent methionine synthase [Clostridia bacterium]
ESLIVQEAADKGMHTNYRYSPGYGDFPIQAQLDIIPALNCEKKIGLTVTDSALMIPHKSVTAIIGVFADKPELVPHGCENCNMYEKCNIRKAGGKCDKRK